MDSATAVRPCGPNPEDNVLELVARAQSGDQSAFEQLYRQHCNRVFNTCMRILADRSEAEELTQRIFIRAWVKLSTFRGDGSFASWLYRLSMNMLVGDLQGSKAFGGRYSQLEELPDAAEPRVESSPLLQLDLERAISSLPLRARMVFALHDVEGLTHEQNAAATGVAVGTSKSQLFRARRILREALRT